MEHGKIGVMIYKNTIRRNKNVYKQKRYKKAQQYIGKKFNHWTITKYNQEVTESHYKEGKPLGLFFDCECDCDKHTVFTHRLSTLIHGRSKSCGCIKFNNPNIIEDLTGQKFGRLTVIGRDIERDKKR